MPTYVIAFEYSAVDGRPYTAATVPQDELLSGSIDIMQWKVCDSRDELINHPDSCSEYGVTRDW